jgi:uncharacterized tannase-like protein DUF6351
MPYRNIAGIVAALLFAAFQAGSTAQHTAAAIQIRTLSTAAHLVTGGDVLVEIALAGVAPAGVKVMAGSRDITAAFQRGGAANSLMGVVTGLPEGQSYLSVHAQGGRGETGTPESGVIASTPIVNYPITGPVISGPWQQPFICQTNDFVLPDGSKLGPPLDANCSTRTVVQYVYRSTSDPKSLKPLPSTTTLPPDVATTTISTGAAVKFIVRVETGTMNRGIYQNAILHDPTSDPPPTPFSPPKGWNRRLIAQHGSGCPSGWYIQGGREGVNILDSPRLAEGYALFINTLNHPTNSCNAFLAGETTMMGKEHFIETFGVPVYTISTGNSGGAYTSLQVADAFPGLIDGVSIGATFPDALSIALAGLDGHLLMHYFSATNPTGFTDAQKVAVSGYEGMKALIDAANQAQRTDPVPDRADIPGYQSARWNEAVPAALRYHPLNNPKGARPTIFDAARNVYGVNPATGAARRPFDNVGVQYGLGALNAGTITVAQFLDLNERIGGIDQDANYTASRSAGDPAAIKRAYQAGLSLTAAGGLASIPVFDNGTSNEAGGYHYGWFHFALRDRLRHANGNSDNMVMWRSTSAPAAQALFDEWMNAYKSDTSADPQRTKVIRARPRTFVEGCYDKAAAPAFIAEHLVFSSKPVSKCSNLYPVYSNARRESGGPLAANVLKCQLKPVDPKDYSPKLGSADLARLKSIFPLGVCDWSKPGVNQTPVVTWASFGPSPVNRIQ